MGMSRRLELFPRRHTSEALVDCQFLREGSTLAAIAEPHLKAGKIRSLKQLDLFCEEIVKTWLDQKKSHLERITHGSPMGSLTDSDLKDCPMTIVGLNDKTVNIYGTRHAQGGPQDLPLVYREFIQKLVRSNTDANTVWLVEQGTAEHFGIKDYPQVKEMDDAVIFVDYIKNRNTKDGKLKTFSFALESMQAIVAAVTGSALKYANKDIRSWFVNLNRLFLGNPDYIFNLLHFVGEIELPQPLNMEVFMVLRGHGDKLVGDTDRSIIQSVCIRDEINQNPELRCINVLDGLGHVSELSWLLTHPEYDPRESISKVVSSLRNKTNK